MICRTSTALAAPAVLAALAGCATVPPEREERDRIILAAVEPCRDKYSDVFGRQPLSVNPDGRVRYWYKGHLPALTYEIDRCFTEATNGLRLGPWAPGKLAKAGPADVAISASGSDVLVPVRMNGILGTMAVRSNSQLTYVTAGFAKRAGLQLVDQSPTTRVRFGDKTEVIPYARARALEVGDASVQALDVAVHDRAPDKPAIDGVLGRSFLDHFKLNVDRRSGRLTLEPR